jgi:hypothetical protein
MICTGPRLGKSGQGKRLAAFDVFLAKTAISRDFAGKYAIQKSR